MTLKQLKNKSNTQNQKLQGLVCSCTISCGQEISLTIRHSSVFTTLRRRKPRKGELAKMASFQQQTQIFAITLISQDDHLTTGAWAACGYSIANPFNSLSSTIVRLASVIY